jgi:arylsulfatase A-like enzyme
LGKSKIIVGPKTSSAFVSQIDLLSSIAALIGLNSRGPDSKVLIDTFLGNNEEGRNELILEASSRTALRKGNWIMIPPHKGPKINEKKNMELGNSDEFQLYNLDEDLEQQKDLSKEKPEKLQEMIKAFNKIKGEDIKK